MRFYVALILLSLIFVSCNETPPGPPPLPPAKDPHTYTWTTDTLAFPNRKQTLMSDSWASSPTDVYVVGYNDQPGPGTMYHYDGMRWSTTHFHAAEGGSMAGAVSLAAIIGFSANEIWLVGERLYGNSPAYVDSSLLIHFDGENWREELNLTPFCRQGEKPVSSAKGELAWKQSAGGRHTIGSSS